MTQTRLASPICGAARPAPGAARTVCFRSSNNSCRYLLKLSTVSPLSRSRGSPSKTIGRTLIAREYTDRPICGTRPGWGGAKGGSLLHGLGIERGGGGVDSGAGLHHLDHHEPHQERDAGHHLKVEQRLEPDAAQFAHVSDARDSGHHGEEDDRGDHHADEFDEAVAERFHHLARGWIEATERDAGGDAGNHAKVQGAVKAGACGHELNWSLRIRVMQMRSFHSLSRLGNDYGKLGQNDSVTRSGVPS